MKIYESVAELIGDTPLLRLNNFSKAAGIKTPVLAKIEKQNPIGSAKDRAAKFMIEKAEEEGLEKGATIIEPTSGNTGISLAALCASKGYKMIITMPENMSKERRLLMEAFGAEVILTPKEEGMTGSVKKAEELNKKIPGSIIAGQFSNPANPLSHYMTTGPEIWNDTDGKVDIFVCGIGTGGTVSGVGKFLKEKNENIKIVGAEPLSSPLLTKNVSGAHKIQGLGANFVPENVDLSVIDVLSDVSDEDAYKYALLLAKTEGVFVGISSGASLFAAITEAKKEENKGKTVVALLCDTGERYLSTPDFI